MKLSISLAALLVLFCCVPAFAANHSSGDTLDAVHSSGVWTWSGSLTMAGNVVVQDGATIILSPGTSVAVTGAFSLTFEGAASLVVTAGARFADAGATPGAWLGLIFNGQSTVTGLGLEVAHATHAIDLNSLGASSLSQCVLSDNRHAPVAGGAYGAALVVRRGVHTVSDCTFERNAVVGVGAETARGGAVALLGGTTVFLRDTFSTNTAASVTGAVSGGAIYGGAAGQIQDCSFVSNSATSDGPGTGGAVSVAGVNITFDGSVFTGNSLGGGGNNQLKIGGAIGVSGVTPAVVTDCRFSSNSVVVSDGYAGGGAIGVETSATTGSIQRNLFLRNAISGPDWCEGGAVDFWLSGTGVVFNNLFVENSASNCGNYSPIGGALMANGDATIGVDVHHNTFVGNTSTDTDGAARGGAVYHQAGLARFANNIIVGNTATQSGGGVQVDATTTPTITNNYIFNNSAPAGAAIGGNAFSGTNDTTTDPLMVGPLTPFSSVDQYRLAATSPARNSATTTVANQPTNDFDGEARPQGPGPDVGFDEINAVDLEIVSLTQNADPVGPGASVIYSLSVRNNSLIRATNIAVTITRSAASTFTSLVASQGTCAGTGPMTCALGTLNAGATASYTLTLTMPVTTSAVTVSAQIATIVLDESDPDDNLLSVTTNVDATGPSSAITSPTTGQHLSITQPVFTGTTEALATVTVEVDGNIVCTDQADALGAFTCTSTVVLVAGLHDVVTYAADGFGNVGPDSATVSFEVDLTPPAAPTITAPTASPPIADATPTVSGTAEALAHVRVFIDSVLACEDDADGSGNFACDAPALSDGAHSAYATASDLAGNTGPASITSNFNVDTDPPDTQIDGAPSSPLNDATPSFSFSADEAGTFDCRIVPGVFAPCTSPATFGPLSHGSYSFEVRARDVAGNVDATPASVTFDIDLVAPDTQITSAPPPSTNQTTASFTFTATETGTFECSLDGQAFAPCVSGVSYSSLASGPHSFFVRSTDQAGNEDASPATQSWTIDRLAPNAPTILTPAEGAQLVSTTPTITGTAEPASVVIVTLDGAPLASVTTNALGVFSVTVPSPLAQGSHVASAVASDAAGNTSAASPNRHFSVDPAALDTALVCPALQTSTATATLAVTATDGSATFECSLDLAAFAPCTSPAMLSGLGAGAHRFEARALLGASVDATPARCDWSVDLNGPAVPSIIDPVDGEIVGTTTPQISGTADPFVSVEIDVDAVTVATVTADAAGNFSFVTAALALGAHTVAARAIDSAGNTSADTPVVSFTVDTLAADTFIVSGPMGVIAVSGAYFDFASNLAGATFECQLDGALFASCADPFLWGTLSDGAHTLDVRAVAGSTDATPATRSFSVDTTAPTSPIVTTPANLATLGTPLFVITGQAEAFSAVSLTIDGTFIGAATTAADGTFSFALTTPLSEGSHTLTAQALDAVSNASAVTSVPFTIDLSAPDTTWLMTPPALSNSANAELSFVANEAAATFECSIDGSVYASCSSPLQVSGLGDGEHTVLVRSIDSAQNQDPTPLSYTWTIDTTPPPAPSISVAVNQGMATVSGTAEPLSVVNISVDGVLVGSVTTDSTGAYSLTLAVTDGDHQASAMATDAAGNTGASAMVAFTVGEENNEASGSGEDPEGAGDGSVGGSAELTEDGGFIMRGGIARGCNANGNTGGELLLALLVIAGCLRRQRRAKS